MQSTLTPPTRYRDRTEAGRLLARHLVRYAGNKNVLVLALPRGGLPVAREVATALQAPLDIFLVRKLGLPDHPEVAMGAIASGGVELLDDSLIAEEQLPPQQVAAIIAREKTELARRGKLYRGGGTATDVAKRTIILVDDGVATGYTMRVAVLALRKLAPARIVVAVPVGAPDTCAILASAADEVICPLQPSPFMAVGLWYDSFPQTSDEEVRHVLQHHQAHVDSRGES